jgi:hypothetical protein
MTFESESILNQDQETAAEGFFKYLFDKGTELIISGPGGVGKTFLMGHLIDTIMPRYHETCKLMGIDPIYHSVIMTATTNKAAEVLGQATNRPTQTIHSFLNLKVLDDYNTGRSKLIKTRNWTVHQNLIIFIDESSMIDRPLLEMIREGTSQCKVIYVGDHCQLAPIMEPISPIYRQEIPFYELTIPMRTDNPHLQEINNQLRETVKTGIFKPIKVVPGVIDYLNSAEMEAEINKVFVEKKTNNRVLAYTNVRVIDYNDYIRQIRSYTETYVLGEQLINNNAIQVKAGSNHGMISVEEEVEIVKMATSTTMVVIDEKDPHNPVELEVLVCDLKTPYRETFQDIPLPVDKAHFARLIKHYSQQKNWFTYFLLKNTYPDLRPRDAATVHKAQGSTYDTVFLDLTNLSTCHNPNQVARMMYVAFTRARQRVVLYGELANKYGSLLQGA